MFHERSWPVLPLRVFLSLSRSRCEQQWARCWLTRGLYLAGYRVSSIKYRVSIGKRFEGALQICPEFSKQHALRAAGTRLELYIIYRRAIVCSCNDSSAAEFHNGSIYINGRLYGRFSSCVFDRFSLLISNSGERWPNVRLQFLFAPQTI